MKTLSFSAKEILPGLLDKTKDQSMRPLFDTRIASIKNAIIKEKELRFSKGEPVRIYWKQRTRFKHFCKGCGSGIKGSPYIVTNLHYKCGDEYFDKIMGGGTITEAFKIYMSKDGQGVFHIRQPNGVHMTQSDINRLADRDSFKTSSRMFDWFDREYKLNSKWFPFAVYRWSWEWD